jgi:hypothetical protein
MSDSAPFRFLTRNPCPVDRRLVLLLDLVCRKASGDADLIGNSKILEPPTARRLRHGLQGFGPSRKIRVAMEHPMRISVGDELRKLALERPVKQWRPSLSSSSMKEAQPTRR